MSKSYVAYGLAVSVLNIGWAFFAVYHDCQILGILNAVAGGAALGICYWDRITA